MMKIGPTVDQKSGGVMSEAQMQKLAETNPNLHWDATKGHLPEANEEFKRVADAYPLGNEASEE